ncbi:SDR family NAD(P)-dependent oxidoreductase [Herbiconiux sp. KACC 21604]|uniref:SDR family NAD(P)-dependent oxidoreductase n=1 Tax=unclassified Herbiconiux TaxID=2618217 RepID=UPI001C11E161|nr:SDR family NAD(P)-dependent oxidoreductase [Herbiconiux sp. SALV-R1]WPO86863.1 SDR family NAD(P)-dependent oxidoreductase [Herbiconiux sp. KACC 21604]
MTINDVYTSALIFVEPTGATEIGTELARRGAGIHSLSRHEIDAAADDPGSLAATLPAEAQSSSALVVAVAPQRAGAAATVDWESAVQAPLRRVFTALRGVVPTLLTREGGGRVVVVLPLASLIADPGRAADSVLGRSLIGLTEGLRAELLGTGVAACLVLTGPDDDARSIAERIGEALETGAFYTLPPSTTAAHIAAVFDPWLEGLAATPSDLALPPLGPMGEVYRAELRDAVADGPSTTPASPDRAFVDEPAPASDVLTPGRTAIVTGGASGIGLGIAEALLDRGMNVAIADVRDDHIAEAMERLRPHGRRAMALRLDVTDKTAWRDGAAATVERFGSIDVLCLNAGIGVLGTILQSTPADWTWLTAVNLDGVTNGIEIVLPLLRAQGRGGSVVATSSAGGLMVAGDGGIYSAAKYGVVAVMDCLRAELAPEGIGVTTLCPAGVNTNIHDHETMRPAAFSASGVRGSDDEMAERQSMARAMLSQAADPASVGRRVAAAVERADSVVFTDGGIAPIIRLRRDAIKAAIALL